MSFMSQAMTGQAEMHIWPHADFCSFGLEQGSSTRGPRASFVRFGKGISQNILQCITNIEA